MTKQLAVFAVCAFAMLLSVPIAHAADDGVAAAWVQLGPGGVNEARVAITGEKCPRVMVDGAEAAMNARARADASFPIRLCVLALPKRARQASVLGRDLPLFIAP